MPRKPKRCPVVMIHGAFCGPWAFDEFRLPFEDAGFSVHAPALRHHEHGQNPPPALGHTSLLDYAEDLAQFAAKLPEQPVLVGHSLGGLLAQMLAARGLARALVLLAPSAPWGVLPSTIFELASSQTLFFAHGDYRGSVIRPSYHIAAAHSLDRLDDSERSAAFARFVPESGQATFEVMHWSFDARRASRVAARGVACPVLCLAGSDDRINPPSTVRRIAQRYDGLATFEELSGMSHWLIGEPGWSDIARRAVKWVEGATRAP